MSEKGGTHAESIERRSAHVFLLVKLPNAQRFVLRVVGANRNIDRIVFMYVASCRFEASNA